MDTHVHVPIKEYYRSGGDFFLAEQKVFRSDVKEVSPDQMIREYDACGIEKIIVLGWDAETGSHLPRVPNELVASYVAHCPERMIGFASVDPLKGPAAIQELEHSVKDLNLRGLKLHPIAQGFYPHENKYYELYEKCVELDIPIIFHTGTTAWGVGLEGGGGAKIDYARPIYLDSLAADFPKLRIIMAHQAFPWVPEQLAIATHKSNVYIDLSGWSPRRFDPMLVKYMRKLLPEKFLFGTDYPFLKPDKWLAAFNELGLDEKVKMQILRDNAVKLLRLE